MARGEILCRADRKHIDGGSRIGREDRAAIRPAERDSYRAGGSGQRSDFGQFGAAWRAPVRTNEHYPGKWRRAGGLGRDGRSCNYGADCDEAQGAGLHHEA